MRSVLTTQAALDGLRDAPRRAGWRRFRCSWRHPKSCARSWASSSIAGASPWASAPRRSPLPTLIEPPGRRTLVVHGGPGRPRERGRCLPERHGFRRRTPCCSLRTVATPSAAKPSGSAREEPSACPSRRSTSGPPTSCGSAPPDYAVVALTPDGALDLLELGRSHPIGDRMALLLGNEGFGLSEAARREATLTVRIAMAGGVDSLNVATACGIALHWLRGRPFERRLCRRNAVLGGLLEGGRRGPPSSDLSPSRPCRCG